MNTEKAYQQALDYLYSFVDYSLTHSFPAPENFDLDRIAEFLGYFGNPHQSYPVIHIAGTKGKGSVAAMCASVLQAAGFRTGLYTSPHLSDYAERIQIDGHPIPHDELVSLVDEMRIYLDQGTRLTTFEISTALAFLYFAKNGADAAVAEVGLGGRLDATNVVQPIVSVITSISLDHTAVLGDTLALIAAEKAGIIKPGVPVVSSPQPEEARHTIERIASQRHAPLTQIGRDILYAPAEQTLNGQSLFVWEREEHVLWQAYQAGNTSQDWQPLRLRIPLLGEHQLENAATAYAALQIAGGQGLKITEDALCAGFEKVVWPGRFELLQKEPPLLVDSAHNRYSAHKLRQTLDQYYPDRPLLLVFGASLDKDASGMLDELMPRVNRLILTRSYHPRSMAPDKLAELARPFGRPIQVIEKIEVALQIALAQVPPEGVILVTGSLFVVGGARDTWYNLQATGT